MFFFQTILHVNAPYIKKMRHFCDIGLHNCNFLLDYNDLTHKMYDSMHTLVPNQTPIYHCTILQKVNVWSQKNFIA